MIYGLGIPNIGVANAKMICREFDQDLERIRRADLEELSAIDGIGEVIAGSVAEFFRKEENMRRLEHVLQYLEFEAAAQAEEQKLKGMTFVITGSVEHFANRSELKNVIETQGGKVTGSVTSKTNYLINNDTASNSSKNKKAKALNIPILSEEDFLQMLQ